MHVESTQTGDNSYQLTVKNAPEEPARIDETPEARQRQNNLKSVILKTVAEVYEQMIVDGIPRTEFEFSFPGEEREAYNAVVSVSGPREEGKVGMLRVGELQFPVVERTFTDGKIYHAHTPRLGTGNVSYTAPAYEYARAITSLNENAVELLDDYVTIRAISIFLTQQLQARSEGGEG